MWFNLVSLFPPTHKDRPNGNRPNLMQKMIDMKPGFLRFPGGNYVEGRSVTNRLKWKETLRPIDQRPGNPGSWGYRSTDRVGLLEFSLWCEDEGRTGAGGVRRLRAQRRGRPGRQGTAALRSGRARRDRISDRRVSTKWGAKRAKDGHPAPFKLRYVEIGNEDGDVVAEGQVLLRLDARLSQADTNALARDVAMRRLNLRRIDAETQDKPFVRDKAERPTSSCKPKASSGHTGKRTWTVLPRRTKHSIRLVRTSLQPSRYFPSSAKRCRATDSQPKPIESLSRKVS
ncbi:hypothetical protein [Roseateles sp. LYH14W]|uniref:Alpha-L-arabinofuranosidase 1 catalytic domain-containing protein n=1 Tax=Pelomonas parva TaxID=3299032 RepID=A0ABW7F8R9_9BURK